MALTTREVLSRLRKDADRTLGPEAVEWAATDEISEDASAEWEDVRPRNDGVAYLQYTSGSTTKPKGVIVTHENLRHNLESIHASFAETQEPVMVTWLPHFHDMGLVFGLLYPLHAGFPCHAMSPASFLQHPHRWLEAITLHRGTHSAGPNFSYDLCVRRVPPERRERLDLSSWRIAVNGAEPVRPESLQRFVDAFQPSGFRASAFCPAYGLAEATLKVTSNPGPTGGRFLAFDSEALGRLRAVPVDRREPSAAELVGCGVPHLGMEVAIVDSMTGRRCDDGTIGEIWVRGRSVAGGYWRRPEESGEVFGATIAGDGGGPFLRTGDLGFLYDGELFVTGRVKDIIVVRGRNHFPQDIEATVETSHGSLRPHCGAAFSVDSGREERLVIVQEVGRRHRKADLEEALQAIRRAVAEEHEIAPHAILLLPFGSVPKTSSGKIQRQACRRRYVEEGFAPLAEWREKQVEQPAASSAGTAPAPDALRRFLVDRLSARTGLNGDVDETQPFASFGLDSASTLELIAELEGFAGRKISPIVFWNYPTIDSLVKFLAGEGQERRSS